jgi:hypothetical protein
MKIPHPFGGVVAALMILSGSLLACAHVRAADLYNLPLTGDTTTEKDIAVKLALNVTVAAERQRSTVVITLARGGFHREINFVKRARAEGPFLIVEHLNESDGKLYRLAMFASDVVLIEERPNQSLPARASVY